MNMFPYVMRTTEMLVEMKDTKKNELIKMNPESNTVYIRNHYDRESKRYSITRWDDASSERFVRGNRLVVVGFDF